MSYQNTEERLNQITDKTINILRNKGIVDQSGKAVHISEFNALVNKAINECMKISKENELSGHIDATSSNVIEARIQSFREMLENQSLSVGISTTQKTDYEQEIINRDEPMQSGGTAGIFKRGIRRIFSHKEIQPVENEDVR